MTLKKFVSAALAAAAAIAFVVGSPATGEAKAKAKAEAPQPPLCLFWHKPVCGVRGGQKFTYENPCFAAKDGAKVIAQHACTVKKAKAHKAKKAMKKPAAKKKSSKKM